jgi:hypothetical protein
MIGRAKAFGKGVSEMNADTQRDDLVLHGEAEAIVEAEWIRLHHDEHWWDREPGEPLAEVPTARPRPPQPSVTATMRGQPRAAPPSRARRWRARRCSGRRVWATQRSPPPASAARYSREAVVEKEEEVMP